ncbi:RNA polymerase sigma factor [Streptomyces cyaneofuscatus]|uniref:RNA polymerase sigma factor n=1 Tax=Streptomyces cyaneofuscatus TaxID=66883 RepID=UPI0033B4D52E
MTHADGRVPLRPASAQGAGLEVDFEAFYRTYESEAFRYIRRQGVTGADVADIAILAFTSVWRRWMKHGPPDEPRPYLYKVLDSSVADHYKAIKKLARPAEDHVLDVPDESEEQYGLVELRNVLTELLPRLSEQQGRVMALHLEGYGAGHIAEILAISPSTVSVHLLRARRALAYELRDDLPVGIWGPLLKDQ